MLELPVLISMVSLFRVIPILPAHVYADIALVPAISV